MVSLQALLKMELEDGYSNLVLDGALKAAKLEKRDEALASALFYGVLERRLTLDAVIAAHSKIKIKKMSPQVRNILRLGVYQLLFSDKIPPSAAVDESVKLTRACRQASACGFVNAVLRAVQRDTAALSPAEGAGLAQRLSFLYSCPQWLVALWLKHYGEVDTEGMLQAFLRPSRVCVRVNTTRVTGEELLRILAEEGVEARPDEHLKTALWLENAGAVEKIGAFQKGLFHVQDLASQLCCQALDAKPGDMIFDVCAAPGGKAFTTAEHMQDRGTLTACDLYESRVRLIESGAKRLGLTCIKARVQDAAKPQEAPCLADRVLCDAPCFGLGDIGRKPEIRYKMPDLLAKFPPMQYNILCIASKLVKPGGLLVYSTCSLTPQENEEVAERFLSEHPDFVPKTLDLPDALLRPCDRGSHRATLLPHISQSDGFFLAAMTRIKPAE